MHIIVESPLASPSAVGSILPYIFGKMRGITGVPLRIPAQAALRQAVTSTSSIFYLNEREAWRRFPDAGRGYIEGEQFTWTARDPDLVSLTGITRGTGGTGNVAHDLGVAIHEFLEEQVFGFFENPIGFSHTSIDRIYVNGILKDADVGPPHTTAVEDTAAAHNPTTGARFSVGTVRFDMTAPVDITSPFIEPSSLAAYRGYISRFWAGMRAFEARRAMERDRFNAAYGGNPNQWSGPSIAGGVMAFPAPAAGAFRFVPPALIPQIGTVTADITGLHDDASGTITGVAGSGIVNPAHVVRCILQAAFQQPAVRFDDAVWRAAALAVASFGFKWALQFFPVPIADLQRNAYQQARLNVFQEDDGKWRAVFRRRAPSVMTLTSDRRVQWAMQWSPLSEVASDVSATYGAGDKQSTLMRHSERGALLTAGRTVDLTFPWVHDAGMAGALAEWHLGLWDHQRRKAVALMHSTAVGLTREDTVDADAPMLSAYGGTALAWRVNGVRAQPDATLEISLEEEEPAGLTVSSVVENAAALWLARRRTAQQRRTESLLADDTAAEEAALTTKRRRRPLRILV